MAVTLVSAVHYRSPEPTLCTSESRLQIFSFQGDFGNHTARCCFWIQLVLCSRIEALNYGLNKTSVTVENCTREVGGQHIQIYNLLSTAI